MKTVSVTPGTAGTGVSHKTEVLATPDWLADHLSYPDLRVVEVDVSPAAYDEWHIDGGSLWNVSPI